MNNEKAIERMALPLFLVSLPLTFIDVLLPMYTSELGFTPVQITGLFSVFSFFLVGMKLLIGRLTDSKGRKFIFISGILFYVFSYYFYAISFNVTYVYLATILEAVASCCIGISTYSTVADLNDSRGHNLGKITGYSNKGGLVGIALCFIVLNNSALIDGWHRLFLICSTASAIAAVYSFINIKNTAADGFAAAKPDLSLMKQKIIILKLIISIFTSAVSAVFVLYPKSRFNADLLEIAIAFLLPAVVIAFISPALGKISDNKGYSKSVTISVSLLFVSLILLPFMSSIYLYGIIWTFYCIAQAFFGITLSGIFTADLKEGRGTAVSMYTIGINIGNIIGPVIGGFLFQNIDISAPFIFSGAAFAVILLSIPKWIPLLAGEKP